MCIIDVSIITSFPKPRPQPERTNGMTLNPHSTNDLDIFRKIMALILHTFWIILTIVGQNLELKIYNLIFFFKKKKSFSIKNIFKTSVDLPYYSN